MCYLNMNSLQYSQPNKIQHKFVISCFIFQDVGYIHGKTMLQGWEKGGLISKLFQEKRKTDSKVKASSSHDVVSILQGAKLF